MQALWGEPRTARSVFAIDDGNEVVLFEEMSPISGCLPSNARWSRWRSEGKARSREDEMAVPPRVLTRPFRCWGFDSSHWFFLSAFVSLIRTLPKKVSVSTATKNRKRNFGLPVDDLLVRERRVKKDITRVEKSRSNLSQGQMNMRCSKWNNKEQGSCTGILSKTNHPAIKAKGRQGRNTGFARDFGLDRRGHKAKRSDARFIYIYIYRQWRNALYKIIRVLRSSPVTSGLQVPCRPWETSCWAHLAWQASHWASIWFVIGWKVVIWLCPVYRNTRLRHIIVPPDPHGSPCNFWRVSSRFNCLRGAVLPNLKTTCLLPFIPEFYPFLYTRLWLGFWNKNKTA